MGRWVFAQPAFRQIRLKRLMRLLRIENFVNFSRIECYQAMKNLGERVIERDTDQLRVGFVEGVAVLLSPAVEEEGAHRTEVGSPHEGDMHRS